MDHSVLNFTQPSLAGDTFRSNCSLSQAISAFMQMRYQCFQQSKYPLQEDLPLLEHTSYMLFVFCFVPHHQSRCFTIQWICWIWIEQKLRKKYFKNIDKICIEPRRQKFQRMLLLIPTNQCVQYGQTQMFTKKFRHRLQVYVYQTSGSRSD